MPRRQHSLEKNLSTLEFASSSVLVPSCFCDCLRNTSSITLEGASFLVSIFYDSIPVPLSTIIFTTLSTFSRKHSFKSLICIIYPYSLLHHHLDTILLVLARKHAPKIIVAPHPQQQSRAHPLDSLISFIIYSYPPVQ